MMNATMWAYAMAMDESIFGPCCYFFATFTFTGMLELAKMFSDPFGDDEVDFPVQIWCDKFLEDQLAYLEDLDAIEFDNFFQSKISQQGKNYWQPGEITNTIGTRSSAWRDVMINSYAVKQLPSSA